MLCITTAVAEHVARVKATIAYTDFVCNIMYVLATVSVTVQPCSNSDRVNSVSIVFQRTWVLAKRRGSKMLPCARVRWLYNLWVGIFRICISAYDVVSYFRALSW